MPTSKPDTARYIWKKETTNSTRTKEAVQKILEEKQLPALPYEIDHVSYLSRRQQSLLQKRRLGGVGRFRHRTPNPNLLRNAGRTTGKRGLLESTNSSST